MSSSCSKPYPKHASGTHVAAELIREIGDIAQIKLWTDKQVFGQEDLNPRAGMKLKMT